MVAHLNGGSGCEAADDAVRIARSAADSVLELHESFGGVTREVAKVAVELGALRGAVDRMARRLDKVRTDSDRPVSHHDLNEALEEITSPGIPNIPRTSSPVRATVERWTGKVVIWLLGLVAAGLVGDIALRLLHR